MTDTILDVIRLNGYGAYVWPAFVFTALVLGGMGWRAIARLRTSEAMLRQMQETRQ